MVTVSKKNPRRISDFAPILFLMIELKGANKIYAIENTAIISEMSFASIVYPSSVIQPSVSSERSFLSSTNAGRNTATFKSIILAMQRDVRHDTRILVLVAFENCYS